MLRIFPLSCGRMDKTDSTVTKDEATVSVVEVLIKRFPDKHIVLTPLPDFEYGWNYLVSVSL